MVTVLSLATKMVTKNYWPVHSHSYEHFYNTLLFREGTLWKKSYVSRCINLYWLLNTTSLIVTILPSSCLSVVKVHFSLIILSYISLNYFIFNVLHACGWLRAVIFLFQHLLVTLLLLCSKYTIKDTLLY